jgi:arginine N-succinyltransferase
MIIIRPIRQSDYSSLHAIAHESGIGFTSLPVNEGLLRRKIEKSEASFVKAVDAPGNQSYLFVMEDTSNNHVVGTTGIEAAVGIEDAFYHYHVGKVVHASRELNIHNTVDILTFCNDYSGVTEICTLFLREEARKGTNGRFLSKVRFLFMMEHPQRFANTIIAEMRGVSDEDGKSPFWQWLEEHFFSMDFPTADYLTGIGNKVFIAELMPKYPIYTNLLSPEAQDVIGKVHTKTKPALQLLEQEGFSCRGYVDIFDAGPTVEAQLQNIRTAQASRRMPIKIVAQHSESVHTTDSFVINTSITDFCAVTTPVFHDDSHATIDAKSADILGVKEGDYIRFAPVRLGE